MYSGHGSEHQLLIDPALDNKPGENMMRKEYNYMSGSDYMNTQTIDDVANLMSDGKIKFEENSVGIFLSCHTGDRTSDSPDLNTNDPNSFAKTWTMKTGMTAIAPNGQAAPKNVKENYGYIYRSKNWIQYSIDQNGNIVEKELGHDINLLDYKGVTRESEMQIPLRPVQVK